MEMTETEQFFLPNTQFTAEDCPTLNKLFFCLVDPHRDPPEEIEQVVDVIQKTYYPGITFDELAIRTAEQLIRLPRPVRPIPLFGKRGNPWEIEEDFFGAVAANDDEVDSEEG